MLKKIIFTSTLTIISISNTYAVSEAECDIWLCAPAGFKDSSCEPAHKAMHSRVHRLLPPLPPFHACDEKSNININNSTITSADGRAAYVPSQTICTSYKEVTKYGAYGPYKETTCDTYGMSGGQWFKDRYCIHNVDGRGRNDPAGCVSTGYYVEVFENGIQIGESYFFNP